MRLVARRPRLGLVVNPIAGMGGRVALKGTDGAEVLAQARARGAKPVAAARALRALAALHRLDPSVCLVAAPGEMGGDVARAAGLDPALTEPAHPGPTTAEDTRAAARAMLEAGVDLLLFAGGDGTARDIHDAIHGALPVLGIPTGVKMHSGLFASTPLRAGEIAAHFLRSPARVELRAAEIADIDDAELRAGAMTARIYGVAHVPSLPGVLSAKSAGVSDAMSLRAACAEFAERLEPGTVYLFGPGTTTGQVLAQLGLPKTLLGVDAVRDRQLVGRDLDEPALLGLTARAAAVHLVLGVIGGQGSLLGRGNQQLSPALLRRIGPERISVLASEAKLAALQPPVLRVDTGDDALDRELSGFTRVQIAPRRAMVMRVAA
jgi:predicted polyphosphate/ATP-dependent NAD kinase